MHEVGEDRKGIDVHEPNLYVRFSRRELEGSVLEIGYLFRPPVGGPVLGVYHPVPRDSSNGHDLLEPPRLDLVQGVARA